MNLRLALAQLNPTVGAINANLQQLKDAYAEAVQKNCSLIAFGELSVTGYPPEDLLLKPRFIIDQLAALNDFAASTSSCVAVVGVVDFDGQQLFNAAAVCSDGKVQHVYHKRNLPNYSVFDEKRYFSPGTEPLQLIGVNGVAVGISICEDIWVDDGPHIELVSAGAEILVSINGSPYHLDKDAERENLIANRASDLQVPICYVNQVGGQDELVFDGGSFVVDRGGELVARAPLFEESLLITDVSIEPREVRAQRTIDLGSESDTEISDPPLTPVADSISGDSELYEALVLGTRDYCHKNGFSDVVIGLSGGIDSTLVACVAVDALGPDHVHGVAMPSRYSSDHSLTDAEALADNLGIDMRTISIEPAFAAYMDMLDPSFEGRQPGLTWENVQSRCRGQILMALSNEFGWMVLTTGNKSEAAVGYFTIYGDSVGGYAVIKDLLKLKVYDLCRLVNQRSGKEVIPDNVITKPPSAELRPDQRDDQSLPPYEVLDPILSLYVEHDRTTTDIIDEGHDPDMVSRITRLVDIAEYKRRQSPPGVRVTRKAFGKDRRVPITNGYR
ncbi:MAG: NAD+ synthase [Actinobacteria bacterium]|nr:NAD+ synthase [Ilumatobacteraceae bacterium]MDA0299492.1 NAD+ synthase [Actinomycetota bacterium]MDA2994732.1 NAD+ synthase [Actinomycetota bacterium]